MESKPNPEENNIFYKNNNNYTEELQKLVEMGFERNKSIEAIQYSNGSVELAIEYLYNGIPILNNDSSGQDKNNNSLDANFGNSENDDEEEHGEDYEDTIYILQKISGILKIISNKKKKSIYELLEIISKHNNKLYTFIKENEDEFLKFMSSSLEKSHYEEYEKLEKGGKNIGLYNLDISIFEPDYQHNVNAINEIKNKHESLGIDIIDLEEDNGNNINEDKNEYGIPNNNNFSEKEKEIINKIKKLGNFQEEDVIQAFLICDKNEELTINYMFEHVNDQ